MTLRTTFPDTWTKEEVATFLNWQAGIEVPQADYDAMQLARQTKGKETVEAFVSPTPNFPEPVAPADAYHPLNRHKG